MRKIIIDTDPGVDDAFAIIAALLSADIEVLGICTVGGNKGLETTTKNALRLVKFMNSDVMVYKGLPYEEGDEDNKRTEEETLIHGRDGLGDAELDFDYANLAEENAVNFIIEMAKKYKGELDIVTVGPPTNIALAIEKDREAIEGIKAIYSMGGAIEKGNVTPYAEFNYWFKPRAVQTLYSIGEKVDIYMLGLDLTHQVILNLNDLYFFQKECGKIGRLLYDMAKNYADVYWDRYHYTGCVIHDLLTVLFMADNGKVFPRAGVKHCRLNIEKDGEKKGQTAISSGGEPNVYLVLDVDENECKKEFMSLICPEKLDLYSKYILKY